MSDVLTWIFGWSRVDLDTGCWIWQRGKTKRGYGSFRQNGKALTTHRAAWAAKNGQIPTGKWVLHKCDNRACCNPDHLYLGTAAENTADMMRRGRGVSPRGSANGKAKITEIVALRIRELAAEGTRQCDIARSLGISKANVLQVIQRKSWAWL